MVDVVTRVVDVFVEKGGLGWIIVGNVVASGEDDDAFAWEVVLILFRFRCLVRRAHHNVEGRTSLIFR